MYRVYDYRARTLYNLINPTEKQFQVLLEQTKAELIGSFNDLRRAVKEANIRGGVIISYLGTNNNKPELYRPNIG